MANILVTISVGIIYPSFDTRPSFDEGYHVSSKTDIPASEIQNEGGVSPVSRGAPPSQATSPIRVDDSKAIACYANFCRVTGTPEELIIDFGLNPQPMGVPSEPVAIAQRLVTNFYTAKRLLMALQLTVQRHESMFGAIEIDVQKRVTPRT